MDQMAIKYNNIFHRTPSKIYPNWYFWFENEPSGNPDQVVPFDNMSFWINSTIWRNMPFYNTYVGMEVKCMKPNNNSEKWIKSDNNRSNLKNWLYMIIMNETFLLKIK
jgi:hypothetical protein